MRVLSSHEIVVSTQLHQHTRRPSCEIDADYVVTDCYVIRKKSSKKSGKKKKKLMGEASEMRAYRVR